MATYYTAPIEEKDVTFKEYLWRCCGAFFHEGKIELEPKADTAHLESWVETAKQKLSELLHLSDEDLQKKIDAQWADYAEDDRKREAQHKIVQARYKKLRNEILSWHPPTADHEGLKKFMLEQLDDSFGGKRGELYLSLRSDKPAVAQYRKETIQAERDSIKRYTQRIADIKAEVKKKTAWIKALVSSIGSPDER